MPHNCAGIEQIMTPPVLTPFPTYLSFIVDLNSGLSIEEATSKAAQQMADAIDDRIVEDLWENFTPFVKEQKD